MFGQLTSCGGTLTQLTKRLIIMMIYVRKMCVFDLISMRMLNINTYEREINDQNFMFKKFHLLHMRFYLLLFT